MVRDHLTHCGYYIIEDDYKVSGTFRTNLDRSQCSKNNLCKAQETQCFLYRIEQDLTILSERNRGGIGIYALLGMKFFENSVGTNKYNSWFQ